jgi:subtilisin family serine protease
MDHFPVEFTKDGTVFAPQQVAAVVQAAGSGKYTDLIVISHGWNNDMADASALYELFFQTFEEVRNSEIGEPAKGRSFAAVCIFWPSKKFTDSELIPGGGTASIATDASANEKPAAAVLQELKNDPVRLGARDEPAARVAAMDEAIALLPALNGDAAARQRFLYLLRSVCERGAEHPDDGTDAFFQKDAEELFASAGPQVVAPPPANQGGVAGLTGGAAGLRDLWDDAVAAARRLANFTTYYQMKRRAGDVGRAGVGPLLQQLRAANPAINIHLVGHSFGGRLVTAAAQAQPAGTDRISLTLLQAAFSHNGLSPDFDGGGHRGAFRDIVQSKLISGPILISHTRNDQAVGIAYPLASRIAHDRTAALGDANDPYGGMGRNGAQRTPEARFLTMLDLGDAISSPYAFSPNTIYNLLADDYIKDHGDICKREVMAALLAAINAAESANGSSAGPSAAGPAGGVSSFAAAGATPDDFDPRITLDPGPERCLASSTALPAMFDKDRLDRWKLPHNPTKPGDYMVELNVRNKGGLPAAEARFLDLYQRVVRDAERQPVRIAKTFFSCFISMEEWQKLVTADERAAAEEAKATPAGANAKPADGRHRADHRKYKCIYRIWPDFPLKGQIDNSVATVKADAALKSYDASGNRIVWAVIDSGVEATHPHFGDPKDPANHTLLSETVEDLHRCFMRVPSGPLQIPKPLEDPDTKPAAMSDADWAVERPKRLKVHRDGALKDEMGHGTHVAGIIAGDLSVNRNGDAAAKPRVFMRKLESDANGVRLNRTVVERTGVDRTRLRGVAPKCRLVSLKVFNEKGEGRASDIIRALEYVREVINDDPKLLRVHGVNLSIGYEFDAELFACGRSPLCAAVDRLVQSGVVVVTAAGNTGYGSLAAEQRNGAKAGLSNTINDPGNAAGAITVGATHRDSPHTYGVSFFSSKGPTGDGRLKPDLVAPGERITSCAVGAKLKEIAGGDAAAASEQAYYIDDSGTSMAAPHVSGAIAAFLSIRREFIGKPVEIKKLFTESATSLGRERYFEGHGLIDVMRAIQSI